MTENKIEVGGSFEMDFESWTQYDDFVSATHREFVAEFTGDIIEDSFRQLIRLTCPISDLQNLQVLLERPGRISVRADFKAYRTASVNEATLLVRNSSASV